MININDVYELSNDLANKYQTGAQFTAPQFNRYIKVAVYDIARKYYGRPEQYQPGMPKAIISYEDTQLISDYLDNLKLLVILPVTRSGEAAIPADYLHYDALDYVSLQNFDEDPEDNDQQPCNCKKRNCSCAKGSQSISFIYRAGKIKKLFSTVTVHAPVTIVKSHQFASYLKDAIRFPTLEYPIAKFIGNKKLQFAPTSIGQVQFNYIRYPKKPFWNSTPLNGDNVYNPTGSQDIELPEILTKEVVMGVLDCIGINTREMALTDISKQFKATGV